ncbi:MarR family EPS-associated transcriptional regulator [Parasphingorhabdus sp.]|uniref:MarR family EPS-associated transcriptional regulator n=1 Tax=Parasphingorhabdus sp. TaxID=2709688 RepID=UPI003263F558
MTALHKPNFREDTRFRVLRLLQEDPELSQRELAEALGISLGAVHYLLRALIDMGFVKLGNFTAAKDKRRYVYILTPRGATEKAAITRRFLARKLSEYEALKQEIAELRNSVRADPSDEHPRPESKAVDGSQRHA